MTIGRDSEVYIQKTTGNVAILSLNASNVLIDNPRSFILDSNTGNAVSFTGTSHLDVRGGQINYWSAAPSTTDRGGLTDIPAFSWYKTSLKDQSIPIANVSGDATTSAFALDADATNLTDDELVGKPLSAMLLARAYIYAVGALPLWVNPIADDNWPIFGHSEAEVKINVAYTDAEGVYTRTESTDTAGAFLIPSRSAVELNTDVVVTANKPFFRTVSKQVVVPVGEITVLETPDEIEFTYAKKVIDEPPVYGRQDDAWVLRVADSRARSTPWTLSVAANRHLSSYDDEGQVKRTLPEALVFVNEDGQVINLGVAPLVIWNGISNGGDVGSITTISWNADRGLLMARSVNPIFAGEVYSAGLVWSAEPTV
ncbi:MAG: hypothetical protein LBV27_05530, partial [Oscillospiraceae bacterium]|jgi:hypothetical protein|nr:hypothetical protein [Oscillospiraceae bacterium]